MSDHTSPARQIAEEKGCSIATVNAKAKAVGISIKGRSPDGHQLLLDALKDVKPRKKIAPPTTPEAAKKTTRRGARKANPNKGADLDLNGFFNQGKVYISEINKRLTALDKEKAMLTEQLERLYALHPGMKK
jgi:hypothetical protein